MAQLAAQDYFARLQASGLSPFQHPELAAAFPSGMGMGGSVGGTSSGGRQSSGDSKNTAKSRKEKKSNNSSNAMGGGSGGNASTTITSSAGTSSAYKVKFICYRNDMHHQLLPGKKYTKTDCI